MEDLSPCCAEFGYGLQLRQRVSGGEQRMGMNHADPHEVVGRHLVALVLMGGTQAEIGKGQAEMGKGRVEMGKRRVETGKQRVVKGKRRVEMGKPRVEMVDTLMVGTLTDFVEGKRVD